MRYDVIVGGGYVVMPHGVHRLDIGIRNGRIAALADRLDPAASAVFVNAADRIVLPGMIDVHVHFNEPNFGHWEGFATGSAALAAGGCTAYLDMPLNGNPPTVTSEALAAKAALAAGKSAVDYGFWGGLVPGNLDRLQEMADAGAFAFKAFMSNPGGEGEGRFREVDDYTLYEGMKRIAAFDGIVALHAESDAITSSLAAAAAAEGRKDARSFAAARPPVAELEAVNRALFFAEKTGCKVHFVHISTPEAVELIYSAKCKGLDITLETCPHYLVLNEDDLERLGPVAKCAPPLRDAARQEGLWKQLADGKIDMITSDHSPCPGSMKYGAESFAAAWGGISGAQSTLELILHYGVGLRCLPLTAVAELLSRGPARRFGLYPRKGEIAVGFDADLAIVDLDRPYTLQAHHLHYRHPHSPYTGLTLGGRVIATLVRGKRVYDIDNGFPLKGAGLPLHRGPGFR
jgi:allantoinase